MGPLLTQFPISKTIYTGLQLHLSLVRAHLVRILDFYGFFFRVLQLAMVRSKRFQGQPRDRHTLRLTKTGWYMAENRHIRKQHSNMASSWWLNQPIWKISYSQIGSFHPQVGVKIKNIWNHHLGIYLWLVNLPLPLTYTLVSLCEALLNLIRPYFWGGMSGGLGWLAMQKLLETS